MRLETLVLTKYRQTALRLALRESSVHLACLDPELFSLFTWCLYSSYQNRAPSSEEVHSHQPNPT